MDSLNHDNQADVIKAFNSTSRYLDDLLNIDNPYFEGMFNQTTVEQSQYLTYRSPLFRNKCLTAKLLQQDYRYHILRKTFSKFYHRHYELISK